MQLFLCLSTVAAAVAQAPPMSSESASMSSSSSSSSSGSSSGSGSHEGGPMGAMKGLLRDMDRKEKRAFFSNIRDAAHEAIGECVGKAMNPAQAMKGMAQKKEQMMGKAMELMGKIGAKLPAPLRAELEEAQEQMKEKMAQKMAMIKGKVGGGMEEKVRMGYAQSPMYRLQQRSKRQAGGRLAAFQKGFAQRMKEQRMKALLGRQDLQASIQAFRRPQMPFPAGPMSAAVYSGLRPYQPPPMRPVDVFRAMVSKASDAMDFGMDVMHKCLCKDHPKGPSSPEAMAEAGEVAILVSHGEEPKADGQHIGETMHKVKAFLEEAGETELVEQMEEMHHMHEKMEKMKRIGKAVVCVFKEIAEQPRQFRSAVELVKDYPHQSMMVAHCMMERKMELVNEALEDMGRPGLMPMVDSSEGSMSDSSEGDLAEGASGEAPGTEELIQNIA